jgi:MFS family permease
MPWATLTRIVVNLLGGMGIQGTGPLLVLAGFMTLGAICNGLGGFILDYLGRRKTYLIGLVSAILPSIFPMAPVR